MTFIQLFFNIFLWSLGIYVLISDLRLSWGKDITQFYEIELYLFLSRMVLLFVALPGLVLGRIFIYAPRAKGNEVWQAKLFYKFINIILFVLVMIKLVSGVL